MCCIERNDLMDMVTGFIDGTINYCPYCGGELDMVSLIDDTYCEDCGRAFCVIEGENNG